MKFFPKLSAGTLHFVGIGGIGMSAIAQALHTQGHAVQGSDLSDNANVQRLKKQGIRVMIGHQSSNIQGACAIITSSAVRGDNPEIQEAQRLSLPILSRAEMLAEMIRFSPAITIGGSHGKTTTTALVGHLLETANLDPTVLNGGIIQAYQSNIRLGQGPWVVAEADESDGSFLKLPKTITIVTTISPEHMDFYKNVEALYDAFLQFASTVPFYGLTILCIDDPQTAALYQRIKTGRVITYGLDAAAHIRAENVTLTANGMVFDVHFQGSEPKVWPQVCCSLLGLHNVRNALAALCVAQGLDIPEPLARQALKTFLGVQRRFTVTGTTHGIKVIDDYAHHPVEIANVVQTARQWCKGRIFVVFQPHRYTRLANSWDGFVEALQGIELLAVVPVYPAGEPPIPGVDSQTLVQTLQQQGQKTIFIDTFEQVAPALMPHLKSDDLILCVGAGDITRLAQQLPGLLAQGIETSNACQGF